MLAQDTSRSLARCPPSDRRQRSRPRFWVPARPMPHTWYQLWPCAFDLRRVCTCLLQRYMTEGKEFCHACKVLVIFFNCMHGTSPSHSHLLPGLRGSHPTAALVVCTAVRSPFSVRLCTSDTVIPPTFRESVLAHVTCSAYESQMSTIITIAPSSKFNIYQQTNNHSMPVLTARLRVTPQPFLRLSGHVDAQPRHSRFCLPDCSEVDRGTPRHQVSHLILVTTHTL
jgi:hypothetical protein